MMPNPRNMNSLREFFKINKGLTVSQLAILANRSVHTIDNWKRKCGINKLGFVRPVRKAKGPPPKNWDNKEWFEKTYAEMGLQAIALWIGKGGNWRFVERKLAQYGIPKKTHKERVTSKNPCCDEGWLHYYYAERNDYLAWCKKEKIAPCPKGGQRLSLPKCSALAGTSLQAIVNWLTNHRMKVRSISESQIGIYNPCYKYKHSPELLRKHRDGFFKNYRAGVINIPIGCERFSNGIRVDKTEIIAKRFNTKIRGAPKRSSS